MKNFFSGIFHSLDDLLGFVKEKKSRYEGKSMSHNKYLIMFKTPYTKELKEKRRGTWDLVKVY